MKENTFKIIPEEFGGIAFALLYSKTSSLMSVSCLFGGVVFCLTVANTSLSFTLTHLLFACWQSVPVPYTEGHVFKLRKVWLLADTAVGTTLACLFLVCRPESTWRREHYRTVEGLCRPQPSTLDTVEPIRHAEARSHRCLVNASKQLCLKQIQVVPVLLKAWQHFLRTV